MLSTWVVGRRPGVEYYNIRSISWLKLIGYIWIIVRYNIEDCLGWLPFCAISIKLDNEAFQRASRDADEFFGSLCHNDYLAYTMECVTHLQTRQRGFSKSIKRCRWVILVPCVIMTILPIPWNVLHTYKLDNEAFQRASRDADELFWFLVW